MSSEKVIKVALANTLGRLIDYLPPDGCSLEVCQPGCRVLVPFGSRKLTGMIVRQDSAEVDRDKLRAALSILDPEPLFAQRDIELLSWAAQYYLADPGEVFMQALPTDLRNSEATKVHLSGWQLCPGHTDKKLSKAQGNACEILEQLGGKAEAMVLRGFGIAASTITSLYEAGIIERSTDDTTESTKDFHLTTELTAEQKQALETIENKPDQFTVSLLEGVTGSGKTEVYIRLAAEAIAQDRQVIVLVPEIGLTPQTLGRFQKALQVPIVTMHSALGDTERCHSWQMMRTGRADLLLGTRSAILPPCRRLGLIIVDEEHDSSYKQQSGFRYNARDMAIARAQHYCCPVVLGSATPSLTSLHNIQARNYRKAQLRTRATGVTLPDIVLLDLKTQEITASGIARDSLIRIDQEIRADRQVLVFVNRRGFAQSLFCHSCGWQAMCQHCDARMTLHHNPPGLICHHCHSAQKVPKHCASCNSNWLSAIGTGTEQITEALEREFPDTRVIRIDQDSIRGKGSLQAKLNDIRTIRPAILVGTQMLAKGHDFPHLSLVVVLGTDNGFYSTDFRALERTCQLLLQVSGRAGRHGKGQVIIQTTNPQSPYLHAVQQHDYQAISTALLDEREQAGMPPYSHIILIRAESASQQLVTAEIEKHSRILRAINSQVEVFGPFEPSIQKLANKYRRQLMLIATNRKLLNAVCQHWLNNALQERHTNSKKIRWTIDVDPYDIF